MAKCPEYIRLRSEVENVLGNLAQVTTLLLELFRNDESERYQHLDKELELTVGEKERAVGALRQHIKDHRCQLPEEPS
jgi:ATP-dependent Clp protease ATP-binding subunit ClpA